MQLWLQGLQEMKIGFPVHFISLGLAKPGLWGVSISLGMIGALMAVAANREDLGYALGMVTFLGGAFGGSYLVVRGVNWKRVSRPLISGAILLTIFLLVVETDSNYYGLSVYEIFTILGFILTSLVLLRDQNSVSDRVLWVGSVTMLILLVLLVPSEFSENGGDGGILLLFLLSNPTYRYHNGNKKGIHHHFWDYSITSLSWI